MPDERQKFPAEIINSHASERSDRSELSAGTYVAALRLDTDKAADYYRSSLVKTEQQKLLEGLLRETGRSFDSVADIACGGGTLAYHLRKLYPDASFTLVDLNPDALEIARKIHEPFPCTFVLDDMLELSRLEDNSFDLVCCWQTLSMLEQPERALAQLIRIARPGGLVYASSLFNLRHDVDVSARVVDHTRPSVRAGLALRYNTYCVRTVETWLGSSVKRHRFHEFVPGVDLGHDGRGLGTYTIKTESGARLQVSGGILMNWAILEIEK